MKTLIAKSFQAFLGLGGWLKHLKKSLCDFWGSSSSSWTRTPTFRQAADMIRRAMNQKLVALRILWNMHPSSFITFWTWKTIAVRTASLQGLFCVQPMWPFHHNHGETGSTDGHQLLHICKDSWVLLSGCRKNMCSGCKTPLLVDYCHITVLNYKISWDYHNPWTGTSFKVWHDPKAVPYCSISSHEYHSTHPNIILWCFPIQLLGLAPPRLTVAQKQFRIITHDNSVL